MSVSVRMIISWEMHVFGSAAPAWTPRMANNCTFSSTCKPAATYTDIREQAKHLKMQSFVRSYSYSTVYENAVLQSEQPTENLQAQDCR